jgi:hypothetical protein
VLRSWAALGSRGGKKRREEKRGGKRGKEEKKERKNGERKEIGGREKRRKRERGERVSAPVAAATAAGRPRAGERTARGGRNRAGVDCEKGGRACRRPPSGARWDSGQVRCRSGLGLEFDDECLLNEAL